MARRANHLVALALAGLTAGMVGAAFAAVPLYQWFCRTTGFGGATVVATALPTRVSDRPFEVIFDANVQGDVPWRFHADVASVTVKAGEVATVTYSFENLTDETITATAVYNVTPETMGGYFDKISCFCFTEQTLGPREKVSQPVIFFIDPAVEADRDNRPVKTVTLSYTFFRKPVPSAGSRDLKPES